MKPVPSAAPVTKRRGGLVLVAVVLLSVAAFGLCEWAGWPFLARPAQHWLSQRLDRTVNLSHESAEDFRLSLLGGIGLKLAHLRVDQPKGFEGEPMLEGRRLELQLDWLDLLRWRSGQPLALRAASADDVALQLHRNAAGQANWHTSTNAADVGAESTSPLFTFGRLRIGEGRAHVVDVPNELELDAKFAWQEGAAAPAVPAAAGAASGPAVAAGVSASARGSLRKMPLQATLRTGSALPWLTDDDGAPAVPVVFRLKVGRAAVDFDGLVRDLLGQRDLRGAYRVQGPSLAAVGAPVRLTLPTTAPFAMRGHLAQQGTRWLTVVDEATVGRSRLAGEFAFDAPKGAPPTLSGRLHGAALVLQDLGPAVGTTATLDEAARVKAAGRVLPDRPFDLPSLRAMNANVLVDIARLDFGTSALQSAAPLHAHVVLQDGVLRIQDLDARLAQGRIGGQIQVDGRTAVAAWTADLQARGLRLEQALRPLQRAGKPPYASGLLAARATLAGRGRSTAEWLASADGRVLVQWTQGTLSHLVVEAAGLDIAEGLGLLLRGDDALKVDCGAADLRVRDGRVTPQVMLVDTSDSTLWFTGDLSLADERLQLVAHVQPKDFSPLTLRTPLHIDGTLAAPVLTLEKGPLLRRVVPAALLAMINPLAALLPLLDPGSTDAVAAAGCRALMPRPRSKAPP